MMRGSLSWLTGREVHSTQASALAVSGVGVSERRALKACPYKAARSIGAGGLLPVPGPATG
jgi:hypothetical protein